MSTRLYDPLHIPTMFIKATDPLNELRSLGMLPPLKDAPGPRGGTKATKSKRKNAQLSRRKNR
jgi:hypothetical protein